MTNGNGWREDVVPRFEWRMLIEPGLRPRIKEGGEIPPGYGIAYYEHSRPCAVLMPLPLNAIVGAWRTFVWHLRCPPWRMAEYRPVRLAYLRGYNDGVLAQQPGGELGRADAHRKMHYDEGYHAGWNDAFGKIENLLTRPSLRP